MSIRNRLLLLLPLLFALTLGCSGGAKNPNAPARVSGQITYKGQPLPGGTITFLTDGNGIYPLAIDKDGGYEGTGLPVGDLSVTIETESLKQYAAGTSYGNGRNTMQLSPPPPGHEQIAPPKYVPIPKKYSNQKTSGLSANLVSGRNTKNFDLAD